MTDLIVKSGVQEAIEDYDVSDDLYDALEDEVAELLAEAARRADANERNTVMSQDV